jgi:hypothetical protein
MNIFPRRGIELSFDCEVLFPRAAHSRPAVVKRFENRSSSARFLTQKAIYRFVITFKGAGGLDVAGSPGDNLGIMLAFIDYHGIVIPYTLHHPHYGEGTAKFLQIEHEIEKVGGGNPPWMGLAMPVEMVL